MEIMKLNLLSPIFYAPLAGVDPFSYKDGSGEKLFCFELDETQRLSIEPDKNILLGALLFGGEAAGNAVGNAVGKADDDSREKLFELPGGNYLFAQERKILNRDDIIAMAVEIQMEGLWQRLLPGKRLYLRYLFEDNRSVTQLFRPWSGEG